MKEHHAYRLAIIAGDHGLISLYTYFEHYTTMLQRKSRPGGRRNQDID